MFLREEIEIAILCQNREDLHPRERKPWTPLYALSDNLNDVVYLSSMHAFSTTNESTQMVRTMA